MNAEQQKQLEQMIQQNETKDNTTMIREMKHSARIRRDVSVIQNIKRRCRSNQFNVLDKEARAQKCGFLFEHYPNIYNKLLKNEIQIQILYRFLDELESIENGNQDQHEASFKIGTLLKQMYVDKKIDMDKENGTKKGKTGMKISYEEFKRQSEKKK
jgi:predicted Zn-ribbon and HTH transcriptional regulator